ncbi:hypothetical protein T03_1276 [Trichinella britovi]|uniref:Uncharacterized protein n=1 Tax=Trichinella britovi TaxID=45882 RepID=A0A0V1CXS6_TRIBR|nr:hypothetical protein T03_1276 [Trichinella britovi]
MIDWTFGNRMQRQERKAACLMWKQRKIEELMNASTQQFFIIILMLRQSDTRMFVENGRLKLQL